MISPFEVFYPMIQGGKNGLSFSQAYSLLSGDHPSPRIPSTIFGACWA
jgi:hypothetical protein